MSQPPLNIVTFGIDPNIGGRVNKRLCARGINAASYVISNTPASDAEITEVFTSKNWDGFLIGLGVRKQPEWYERILQVIKNANPNVSLIQQEGESDVEDAIQRHFKIQLPPAST